MTDKTKDAIRAALFEASFVLLGVLLALGANEWRQTLADRDQAEQALETILLEVKANRDAVAEALKYHSGLLEMLHADHEPGWAPSPGQFTRGFISPARTARTAWDSASETGALTKSDFDVVVELANVYSQQDRYEDQARAVGGLIYERLLREGLLSIAENHSNLASVIATFYFREQQLLALYDETLASLREN